MREISWRMARWYYTSWNHSHCAVAHYTLFEMLIVFSLCITAQISFASPNSGRLYPLVSSPCTAPQANHPGGWFPGLPAIRGAPHLNKVLEGHGESSPVKCMMYHNCELIPQTTRKSILCRRAVQQCIINSLLDFIIHCWRTWRTESG